MTSMLSLGNFQKRKYVKIRHFSNLRPIWRINNISTIDELDALSCHIHISVRLRVIDLEDRKLEKKTHAFEMRCYRRK